MEFEQKISFSDAIFAQEVDGEMVLLDMNSESYFGLDEVGCSIWQAMQEHKVLQEAYDALLEIYDVEPDRLEGDLVVFVEQLRDAGLIELQK
jgi:hypothetical protein